MGLVMLALGCAVLFGLREKALKPLSVRATVKAGAIGGLAGALAAAGGFGLLTMGLIASAIGDFLLALERKTAFALGMMAFLIAHCCYGVIFLSLLTEAGGAAGPAWPRLILAVSAVIGAVLMLAWLWRDLGWHRISVPIYMTALLGMAILAWQLPWAAWPTMIGALLFLISDAILAAQTFRQDQNDLPPILRGHALVWWTYVAAQALIVTGVLLVAPEAA
jgi:uncharacterized membrane protein YhhN